MASIYPSSTSSSTSSANLLRISGMSSGIDTDAVVKSMVSNYQLKIDKANQERQLLGWKQEAYRDIIKSVKGLQDYFDPLSSKYILSENSFNTKSVKNSDSSIVSATAGSTAKAGTYSIAVTQLAEQAKVDGSSLSSTTEVLNADVAKWSGAKITLGATEITLDAITDSNLSGTTLDEVVANINKKISQNSTLNGKVSASYVQEGTRSYIKFINTNSGGVTAKSADGSTTLGSIFNLNSTIKVEDADASKWSGAKLTLGIANITLDTVTDANGDGTILDEVVANINSKISGSTQNGMVQASYVKDGTGSYIKFTNSFSLTAKTSDATGNAPLGTISSINSGISSSTKLSDLGITTTNDMKFNLSYDAATTTTPISITAKSTDTLQTLMDKVNSATSGSVTMTIDDNTGKISFKSKNYGSTSTIKIEDTSADLNLSKLGIASGSDYGGDAVVAITAPGEATMTTTQNSNTFTANGVTYNISKIGTATTTITSDSGTVVDNMKKFIDDYNSVISKINTKLTEKKNSDYKPLTDEQKESMSESQITTWETKAKVGILRNDDYLNNLMTQLRGVFSSPVYNSYDSANPSTGKVALGLGQYGSNAVGIDTSKDYTDGGKLVLKDEAKLKNAIENHLEDLKKLFIGESSSGLSTNQAYIGSKKYSEDGIFKRMDTMIRDYVASPGLGKDGTYTLSGSMNIFVNKQYDYSNTGFASKNTLPDQVYSKLVSINKYKDQLNAAQTRYYNKFTALETAMNNLNSQQSQLSSALGSS